MHNEKNHQSLKNFVNDRAWDFTHLTMRTAAVVGLDVLIDHSMEFYHFDTPFGIKGIWAGLDLAIASGLMNNDKERYWVGLLGYLMSISPEAYAVLNGEPYAPHATSALIKLAAYGGASIVSAGGRKIYDRFETHKKNDGNFS